MTVNTQNRRLRRIVAFFVGAVGLCAMAVPLTSAQAQVPYLGVDFGGGVGIGLGVPPSAYGVAPFSPISPFTPYPYPPAYTYAPAPYYYPW